MLMPYMYVHPSWHDGSVPLMMKVGSFMSHSRSPLVPHINRVLSSDVYCDEAFDPVSAMFRRRGYR
jgi:hypothetical protein